MRLTSLDPRWLRKGGVRIGFIFRCPLEPSNARRMQSCFFAPTPRNEQWELFEAHGIPERIIIQGCNPACGWICQPSPEQATFESISITPSLDGSAGGNWHGYITNGEIVGGL